MPGRVVRAGPARERPASPAGRIPETLINQVFGAPYPRRGAMVVPSGIAQAIPGRSHLAIPGQIGPSRHHHCPAHFAAEPPRAVTPPDPPGRGSLESSKERRDRVCPSRTVFGQGWPKRSAARPSLQGRTRGVSWTGTPDPGAGLLERKVSGTLRGNLCRVAKATLSRAGPAPIGESCVLDSAPSDSTGPDSCV